MKLKGCVATSFLMIAAATSVAASAVTVVDTGLPNPKQVSDYETIGYNNGDLFGYFVSSVNTITGLQGYFQSPPGGAEGIATLYNDNAGSPGTIIGSASFSFVQPSGYNIYGPSDLSLTVEVGASYWVGFRGAQSNLFYTAGNVPNPLGRYGAIDFFTSQFARDDSREFGVIATGRNAVIGAVPEPSTWTLLFMGSAAVGAALRRRKDRDTGEAARA